MEPKRYWLRLTSVDGSWCRAALAVVVAAVIAGCGDDATVATGGTPGGSDRPYTVTTTVLESPEHGPQLCLGGVAESLPPQCGGPDIVGWDWESVADEESELGTTWGVYAVIGTYDGEQFTLTEPPQPGTHQSAGRTDELPPTTPCDTPPGGWAVVDPSTATDEAMFAAQEYAYAQPSYSVMWLDQSINPALADGTDPSELMLANDPTKLILNVRFTSDLQLHEERLRTVWGGALCVSKGERTESELLAIQEEVQKQPGVLGSGAGNVDGVVDVSVIVDDGTLQRQFDERFGRGSRARHVGFAARRLIGVGPAL